MQKEAIKNNDTIEDNPKIEEANDDGIKYFEDGIIIKSVKTGINMDYYIKISKSIKPIEFMNKLANKIYLYEDNIEIEQSQKKPQI